MTTRTMKLLGATTALVALASGASATTVTTVSSTANPVATSTTTGGIYINGGAGISTTSTGPAITLSTTTAADNIIQVSSSGVIYSNDANSATISASEVGAGIVSNSNVVINNSGTIANFSTGGAITLSGTAGNTNTIRNAGTISGSITGGAGIENITNTGTINGAVDLGADNNSYTQTGSGRLNGNLTTGANDDTITIGSGTVLSGTLNVAAGANVMNVSGSILGTVTSTGGADILRVTNGGLITGAVSLGDAANVVTLNNGTLRAGLTTGTGNDILIISNSSVISGTTDLGAGTNSLYLYDTFTSAGAITTAGTAAVQVSGTTTLRAQDAITGVSTLGVGAGSTLNVNRSLTASGILTNAGTVHLASETNLTATSAADGGKFILDVGASGTVGHLSVGASTFTNTSWTINVGQNAGFIASGQRFVIVDGSAGLTGTGALTNGTQAGVMRYTIGAAAGNDIEVSATRVSTTSVLTDNALNGIANELDLMATRTNSATVLASNTALAQIHTQITAQTTAQGVADVLQSAGPDASGLGATSIGITTSTGNQVSNRLASLRSNGKGVATGDMAASRHMWAEGFGSVVEQDDQGTTRGYDASSAGASFGMDTEELVEGFTTGVAFSYGNATVDSNNTFAASTDIDTYVGTVYGSHVLNDGSFINAQAALGMNNYDSSRVVAGVGTAKADFDGMQASVKGEIGKDFAMDMVTLTPMAGLQYSYLNVDDYTETGAAGANLSVDPEAMSALDASLGGQASIAIPMGNGGTFKPNVHAKYIYRMGDDSFETTSRFSGGGSSFTTSGVETDKSSLNLGAGLLLTTAAGVDFSVNYDADIRDSLTGHTGQLKARWAF